MKENLIKFAAVLIPLSFLLMLSDCQKDQEIEDYYVVDISQNTDWDFWAVAKDGNNFFVKRENNKPIMVYFQPDKTQEGFTIFFDEVGLPSKAIIQGTVVLYSNFRNGLVDAAIIYPENEFTIVRDIVTNVDLTLYELKAAKTEMSILEFLKLTDMSIGVATCVASFILPPGLNAIAIIGCGATILELISEALPEDFKILGVTATGMESFANTIGCITFDASDCIEAAALASLDVTIAAIEDLGEQQSTIYDAYQALANNGIVFNPNLQYGFVTDIDGNVYKTIQIGTQTWTAENIRTTKLNDGTSIVLLGNTHTDWQDPIYCYYDSKITYKSTYGALYNFFAAQTGKICPTGWHVPSRQDWETLLIYLQSNGFNYDGTLDNVNNYSPTKVGKALASDNLWSFSANVGSVGNTDFTSYRNLSGFTALPGGCWLGGFSYCITQWGCFWSSDINAEFTDHAWGLILRYDLPGAYLRNSNVVEDLYSVRCIKD